MPSAKTLAIVLASVAVSGCASFGAMGGVDAAPALSWKELQGTRGGILLAEQPAPPPAGLRAFCARVASACQEPTAPVIQRSHSTEPAGLWSPIAFDAASTGTTEASPEALFARMLEMRVQALAFRQPRHEMTLDQARWAELGAVNEQVNDAVTATTDINRYGLTEYWAMPLTERGLFPSTRPEGDCEDFALEKRAQLIALGWDREALALAVADAPGIGMHAVLIAQTDHGDFVLDNMHDAPRPIDRLNYRWVSRQAGGSMTAWATARLEQSPLADPVQVLQASIELAGPDAQTGGLVYTRHARPAY